MTNKELRGWFYHPAVSFAIFLIMVICYESGLEVFSMNDIMWEGIGYMILIFRLKIRFEKSL